MLKRSSQHAAQNTSSVVLGTVLHLLLICPGLSAFDGVGKNEEELTQPLCSGILAIAIKTQALQTHSFVII